MKLFHAHVYFESKDALAIEVLRVKVEHSPLTAWKLFEKRVGPHDLPMLELRFDESKELEAMEWLRQNRGNFSVLVHEDTGDDVKDHENPRWFGNPLPIHFEFFDQVKRNPEVSVHPVGDFKLLKQMY